MKLLIALLLNVLMLLALTGWLRREYRRSAPGLRRWLLPALAWRVLLTVVGSQFPGADARNMSAWGRALTADFWAQPGAALALWQGQQLGGGQVPIKYAFSNTLFFVKILGLLNLASLGSDLLNALYLSLFCFVGCWLLVRTWARVFPATPVGAAVVALLLWPSVVWWTAGITKETVLVGSEAALVALVLRLLYGPPGTRPAWPLKIGGWLVGLALAWLAGRLRYFFALPLLGVLLALAAVRLGTRRGWLGRGRWPQALALLAVLGLGGWCGAKVAASRVPAGFYTRELYGIYQHGLLRSVALGRPHLWYPHLAPTAASLLRHAPVAVGQVFTRPRLAELAGPQYVAAALENLLLLALAALAALALARGRPGRLPLALALGLLAYCLLVAAFIGLSTPNFGTLSRYRAALLPWLLLLLLQNDYARRAMGD